MVGYADGCVGPTINAKANCALSTDVSANKLDNHGAILRQISGKTLFKAYDPKTTVPPVVVPPVSHNPGGGTQNPGGGLAATGGTPLLALAGLLLLGGGAFWLRRRQQG